MLSADSFSARAIHADIMRLLMRYMYSIHPYTNICILSFLLACIFKGNIQWHNVLGSILSRDISALSIKVLKAARYKVKVSDKTTFDRISLEAALAQPLPL